MKSLTTLLRCSMLLLAVFGFSGAAAAYTYVVQPANVSGHVAVLQSPAWAGEYIDRYLRDRNTILIVTPLGPPLATAENPHPIGVYYNGSRWAIFNQDLAPMPAGAAFEVEYSLPSRGAFVHRVATQGRITYLPPAALSDYFSPRIFVTSNWNPPGGGGGYNNHLVGVFYDPLRGWAIINEDGAELNAGAAFNVYVIDTPNSTWYNHTTSAATISGNASYIQGYPVPEQLLRAMLTHNASPLGCAFCFILAPNTHNHVVGLRYDPGRGWAVYNLDGSPMREGLRFNIYIESVPG